MKVLSIDTTRWNSSVALWEDGKELSFKENNEERSQASLLPSLVKRVMGIQKADLMLVNIGPGSFTGIRVSLAFAKGLARGWSIPLKGMNSFMATYGSLNINSPGDVLILKEARRSDVFSMLFKNGQAQKPQSLTYQDLSLLLTSPSPPSLAGSGLYPFLEGLLFKEVFSPWQGAQELAYTFFKNPTKAIEASPFYAREADVSVCSLKM